MIIWMFSLDHTHHERWTFVFIGGSSRPSIYASEHLCFSKGYFAVKNCKRIFSNIKIDQAIS